MVRLLYHYRGIITKMQKEVNVPATEDLASLHPPIRGTEAHFIPDKWPPSRNFSATGKNEDALWPVNINQYFIDNC